MSTEAPVAFVAIIARCGRRAPATRFASHAPSQGDGAAVRIDADVLQVRLGPVRRKRQTSFGRLGASSATSNSAKPSQPRSRAKAMAAASPRPWFMWARFKDTAVAVEPSGDERIARELFFEDQHAPSGVSLRQSRRCNKIVTEAAETVGNSRYRLDWQNRKTLTGRGFVVTDGICRDRQGSIRIPLGLPPETVIQ